MKRIFALALALFAGLAALRGAEAIGDKDDAFIASRRNWWSWKRPVRATIPAINHAWVRTPIDAFLLEAMHAKGVVPAPALDRERLIRRVTLDLIGLPPTPEEVAAFTADKSPDAYAKLVDRLMSSPHYGERWAIKWLDVVRYSDTNGYEADGLRPHAWRYRDYVMQAFNHDKPFDRFVREQVAGDELFPGDREALIATGFNRAGPIHLVGGNTDPEESRQEVLNEMTGAIGSVFLGVTIGCARCHNHKFDAIPQADYYRLQAVFAATENKDLEIASAEEKKRHEAAVKEYKERLEPIKKQIEEIEKPYRERLREEKRKNLEARYLAVLDIPKEKRDETQKTLAKEAEAQIKVPWDELLAVLPPDVKERRARLRRQMHAIELDEPDPVAMAFGVVNMDKAPATHILRIGNPKMKMGEVGPGFLRVVSPEPAPDSATGRRAALANWLVSEENPLTARVTVNRIWQLRMGTGIVSTPNDFGVLGAKPSNVKLLDWLATEFVSRGWSVKAIDRMILLSSAYRQAIAHNKANAKIDPDNKLYWRANRRRLEAELLRDSVLAVSGAWKPVLGGKPTRIPVEPEIYDLIFTEGEPDNLWPVDPDLSNHARRSIYLLNKRTIRFPFLANFDQPDNMSSCPVRATSTHALQALSLMNSDLMREESRRFAARIERDASGVAARVQRAYRLALARDPRAEELRMAREFLGKGAPLEDFCLALLNRTEFAYVP